MGGTRRKLRRALLVLAMAGGSLPFAALGAVAPVGAASGTDVTLYGLRTTGTSMVRFDSANPSIAIEIPITGLKPGDFLRGIDTRPSDGQLYGFSVASTYRIDKFTGAATLIGTGAQAIAVPIGYDIDPIVDQSREVATLGGNLRTNLGTGAVVATDSVINPAGFSIAGLAYTTGGTSTTTLFGIDSAGDRLVKIGGDNGVPSPNLGTVTVIGPLGVDTTDQVGFDIDAVGTTFASLTTAGVSSLYQVNRDTGAATLVGPIPGGTLTSLAIGSPDPITRLAGPDRIDTAVATSQSSFPAAGSAPGVVLARSDVAADALSGTPLTKVVGGPLLLTTSGVLDGRTQAELVRLLGAKSGRTVHLLGGTAAISDNVKTQIEGLGYVVVRHGGADRFETAAVIAAAMGSPGTVFLADGTGFADALIAGVAAVKTGGVVLLTNGTTLPASTSAYLTSHPGARFTLGPSSTAFPAGTVIPGADPFDRSVALANQFWPGSFPTVGVASGEAFPDGLTGGAHIARIGGPLFLVTSGATPPPVEAYLNANHITINGAFVYGGSVRITDSVVAGLGFRIG